MISEVPRCGHPLSWSAKVTFSGQLAADTFLLALSSSPAVHVSISGLFPGEFELASPSFYGYASIRAITITTLTGIRAAVAPVRQCNTQMQSSAVSSFTRNGGRQRGGAAS